MGSIIRLIGGFSRPGRERSLAAREAESIGAEGLEESTAILDSAKAASDAAVFNAGIAARNRKLALESSQINESRLRRRTSRLIGSQNVAIAGSGFSAGSFDDVQRETIAEEELDALLIRRNGKIQAASLLAQESLSKRSASEFLRAGAVGSRGALRAARRNAQTALLTGNTRARAAGFSNLINAVKVAEDVAGAVAGTGGSPAARARAVLF